MRTILFLACLAVALAPAAQAGTATDPEITDAPGDGGTDTLDILKVWIDPNDATHLALHVVFAAAPPAIPEVQSTTAGTDACTQSVPPVQAACIHASLTYVFTFRVFDPSGNFTPRFSDYAYTSVTFRDGPTDPKLASPVGYIDTRGILIQDGSVAIASLNGTELTLRIPRSNPFINLPAGRTPGPYAIDRLSVYSVPELCFPSVEVPTQGKVTCAPMAKPVPPTTNTPPGTVAHWDNAPDNGYGRVLTFPSPAGGNPSPQPTSTVTITRTQTVTQTVTHNQPGSTVSYTTTVTMGPDGPVTVTVTQTQTVATGGPVTTAKKSAAPEIALVLLGMAGLIAATRRRLSE